MAQKQKNGLATHPGVSPRGPFLSLPRRDSVEKLSRAPAWGKAKQGTARFCACSWGQDKCQEGRGQRLMEEGPLWKPGLTASPLLLPILPGRMLGTQPRLSQEGHSSVLRSTGLVVFTLSQGEECCPLFRGPLAPEHI